MPSFVRDEFERLFSETFGFEETVAVNSGTSALIACLYSLDLKPGDEVITTAFTFIATANAIKIAGGTPVFVDIHPESKLIDERLIRNAITPKTRAIVPVHLYGRMCNMPEIAKIAAERDLVVIEDCAQSLGSSCTFSCAGTGTCKPCIAKDGFRSGALSDASCFSFYKTKNLSTFEGGAVGLRRESKLDPKRVRAVADQGQVGRYNHLYVGFNFRLAEPLCLLGIEAIKIHERAFMSELGMRDESFGHYPYVVYDQAPYAHLGLSGTCPNAENAAQIIRDQVRASR